MTFGDIAAFGVRDAVYEQARAQEFLARETARANEILINAENARNLELKKQFEMNQEEAKQEKFAKGLLVKTELLFETLDYNNIKVVELAKVMGEISSLLKFSKDNGLLEDFFSDLEDIRYAHKILNEANIQFSKAQKFYERIKEVKLEEEILSWLKKLDNIYLTNVKQNAELDSEVLPLILTAELFSAYWFLHNSTKLLRERFQNDEFNSVIENAIEETEKYIQDITEKLSDEDVEEMKLLFSSFEDFRLLWSKNGFPKYKNGPFLRVREHLNRSETKQINLEKLKSDILNEKSELYLQLQEAEFELEKANFLKRPKIKSTIFQIKAKIGNDLDVIEADLKKITSDIIPVKRNYEIELQKAEKIFNNFFKCSEFKSCFGHLPEFKPEDPEYENRLLKQRCLKYLFIILSTKQRFPWSFTKEDITPEYSDVSLDELLSTYL